MKTVNLSIRIFSLLAGVLAAVLSSCGSTHKTVNRETNTMDSVITAAKDSTYKKVSIQKSDNLELHDVDIVLYGDLGDDFKSSGVDAAPAMITCKKDSICKCDSERIAETPSGRITKLLKETVNASGLYGKVSAVYIHVGSISDSSGKAVTVDTGALHTASKADLKKSDSTVSKTKQVTNPIWIVYVLIPLALFIICFLVLKRFKIL